MKYSFNLNTFYFLLPIKIVLHSFRHVKKLVLHLKIHRYNSLINIFKILFINIFYILPFIRNYKNKINIKKVYADENINEICKKNINELYKIGCTTENVLHIENVNQIIKEIFFYNKENIILRNGTVNKGLIIKNGENVEEYAKRLAANKISRIVIPIDLSKSTFIKKLIMSKFNVDIAKNFLKSNRFSISASCHLSSSIETTEKEKLGNAQLFHFDNDFSNFLKFYLYLTNVSFDEGPHTYINETNKIKDKEHILMRPISDKKVMSKYISKKTYLGSKGTYFFTDGFGIHKGEPLKKNYRLILNVHYGLEQIKYYKYDEYVSVENS